MNEIETLQNRIKELEAENKQLKKDLEHALSHKHTIKMWNRNLHTENEKLKGELRQSATNCNKLKCLALHLMSDFLWLKNRWIWYFIDSTTGRQILSEDERKSRLNKARRIQKHALFYLEAYRKSKKKLMEGK